MPFEIVQNDITLMQVDAIVNTANPMPVIGTGVDTAVHQKAGVRLLEARKQIGPIAVGDAAVTEGFDLPARYVIHTVGPDWQGGRKDETLQLASCYRKSLELAKQYKCESVAFPLIASGNYGFPKSVALQTAVFEIRTFLTEHDMTVYLVVFDRDSFELSEKLFKSVKSYIDAHYIHEKAIAEYGIGGKPSVRRNGPRCKRLAESPAPIFAEELCMASEEIPVGRAPSDQSLEEILKELDAGFSETLLRLIDRTGKKDSEVYGRANIDRRLFSKIRNNPNYRPTKETALAFAFALELSIDEARELIGRAGFALSHSSKFDVIVEYFLIHRKYDIDELNQVLFAFDQPLICA